MQLCTPEPFFNEALMFRIAFLFLLLIALTACQKNTYELANAEESADSPVYTTDPDLNRSGSK